MDAVAAAAAAGPHAQGPVLASWERHTRGIGSKLLASMGFQAGKGLGVSQQGMVTPLEVVLGSAKAGLGAAGQAKVQEGGDTSQRRTRRRAQRAQQRRERAAQAQHEAALATERGMFTWLNSAQPATGEERGNCGSAVQPSHGTQPSHGAHQALQRQERVRRLEARAQALKETAGRQQGNAGVAQQVARQLAAVERQLVQERAASASAASHDAQRAAAKKLLKF